MLDFVDLTMQKSSWNAGDEPLPGYRLLEPLGRGGFGEVWKCTVPGGLAKALKFVKSEAEAQAGNGAVDVELNAIQHIKQIRHPFVLSTERIEMVDGVLMIVMELADRNLNDLFEEYRQAGSPGVPRDELLRLLLEAAEALDFLNFQFGLQHLDVKPQNLFLLSDHLKIGDFGLVNHLESAKPLENGETRQVGMTLLYAAPERLQGTISRNSDQYSLAIVYQEMLTGVPPLGARTRLELVTCHLQRPPNLSVLAAAEQPIVARALAKKAEKRFPSCKDFIKALINASERPPTSDSSYKTPTESLVVTARQSVPKPAENERRGRVKPRGGIQVVEVPSLTQGQLPNHEIVSLLGWGRLGELYCVRSSDGVDRLARFPSSFANNPAALAKFTKERLAVIKHRALPPTDLYVSPEGRVVAVTNAAARLEDRFRECMAEGMPGIPRKELIGHLRLVADALDELAERYALRHLALQPSSIHLIEDGVWVLDFGLAELLQATGMEAERWPDGLRATYDSFSLALIFIEMLSGHRIPLAKASSGRVGDVNLDMMPGADQPILARALSAHPRDRFQTCGDLITALDEAISTEGDQGAPLALPSVITVTPDGRDEPAPTLELPPAAAFIADILGRGVGVLRVHDEIRYLELASGPIEYRSVARLPPALLKLKLDAFREQWGAEAVESAPTKFRYRLFGAVSAWQRLLGRTEGLEIRVEVINDSLGKPQENRPGEVVVRIESFGAQRERRQAQLKEVGPVLLHSLASFLMDRTDRRAATRWPFPHAILVHPIDMDYEMSKPIPGHCRDISEDGIGFLLPEQPPTDHVYISFPSLGDLALFAGLVQINRVNELQPNQFDFAGTWVREITEQAPPNADAQVPSS
jgi:serine/threonine protein kinase